MIPSPARTETTVEFLSSALFLSLELPGYYYALDGVHVLGSTPEYSSTMI